MPFVSPTRMTAGFTQEPSFRPFGQIGVPNPAFYAQQFDDFTAYDVTGYTVTASGNGAAAQIAGAGGVVQLTTNSSTPLVDDIASIQCKAACMGLVNGYKALFAACFQVADITNPAFLLGLIQTTATPFTVTDGIYFSKASGSTNILFNHAISSVITSTTIPVATSGLAANTYLSVAVVKNQKNELEVYVGEPLVGQVLDQNRASMPVSMVARLAPAVITTAVLNPTLALQSGTASSKTMNVDYVYAATER